MPPPPTTQQPPELGGKAGVRCCRQGWGRVPAPLPPSQPVGSPPLHDTAVAAAEVSLGQASQRDRVALPPVSISGCCHSDAAMISVTEEPINK